MTISAQTNRKSFTGAGTSGPFSFPYALMAKADLVVKKVLDSTGVATTLVLDTDYTLAGTADSVGRYPNGVDITTTSTVAAGYTLVAYGDPALTQALDLVENDPLPVEELEKALDRLTLIVRRLRDMSDRSVTLSDTDTSGADTMLPDPEASKLIGWNAAGDGFANYATASIAATIVPTAFMETLLDDTTAAAARSTLGAASSTDPAFTGTAVNLGAGMGIVAEGATDNAFETTLAFTDPTADRTLTFPDATGTVATTADIPAKATSAELATGTDNAKYVTAADILAALGFSKMYTSGAQTITPAGALTLAHGIGRAPVMVSVKLKNTSTELNYSVNDEVWVSMNDSGTRGVTVVADSTNLNVRYDDSVSVFTVRNKTTGAEANIDNTKWSAIFYAWG